MIDFGEDLVVFENPSYEGALVGISSDNRAVYEYSLMVKALMAEGMNEDEAEEWIEYNTIRALPYVKNSPIVMRRISEEE